MRKILPGVPDTERHAGKWRLLLCGVLVCCLYAGLRPEPLPQPFRHFDLTLHFSACLAIAYMSVFAFRPPWRRYMMLLLLLTTFALEIAQGALLSRRAASLLDCLAGIAGIPLGWLIARWVRRHLRRWCKEKNWRTERIRNPW